HNTHQHAALINPATMHQGPVPDIAWHVASNTPEYKHGSEDQCPVLRVEEDQSEKPDVSHGHHTPHLVGPVTAMADLQQCKATSGGDCHLMPGNHSRERNCVYRAAKQ